MQPPHCPAAHPAAGGLRRPPTTADDTHRVPQGSSPIEPTTAPTSFAATNSAAAVTGAIDPVTGHAPRSTLALPARLIATVIDAKATEKVKLGAKVQVTYYTLFMEALLVSPGYKRRSQPLEMSDVGGVWLYGKKAPLPFALGELRRMLRGFLATDLPRILSVESATAGNAH